MQKVLLRSRIGEVEFTTDKPSGTPTPYVFNTIYGTGKPGADVAESRGGSQTGTTYHTETIRPRDLELNVYAFGTDRTGMYAAREWINAVISDMQPLYVEYTNDYGAWYIYGTATSTAYDARIEVAGHFTPITISLHCTDPVLRALNSRHTTELGYLGGRFKFPFVLQSPGVRFGAQGYTRTIRNNGRAEAPVKIEIQGPAHNPRITNLTTGQTIALDIALSAVEVLVINTAVGQKQMDVLNTSTGQVRSAWKHWAFGGAYKLWNLAPGENEVLYRNDGEENIKTTKISITSEVGSLGI